MSSRQWRDSGRHERGLDSARRQNLGLSQSFGRFGIPFNAVYGPTSRSGIILPELLTAGLVWDALSTASGGNIVANKNFK